MLFSLSCPHSLGTNEFVLLNEHEFYVHEMKDFLRAPLEGATYCEFRLNLYAGVMVSREPLELDF